MWRQGTINKENAGLLVCISRNVTDDGEDLLSNAKEMALVQTWWYVVVLV